MHAPHRPPIPVETLLLAYRSGIFPMADRRDDPEVFWVEPRERAIIPLEGLHLSKSLRKVIRADRFAVTVNRAFEQVIRACAEPRADDGGAWLGKQLIDAYIRLHQLGHAHSVECWYEQKLVGGIYGVALGGLFAGESMFSRVSDGSKMALTYLVQHLSARGFELFDVQATNAHTISLGAIDIPREEYLLRLSQALAIDARF